MYVRLLRTSQWTFSMLPCWIFIILTDAILSTHLFLQQAIILCWKTVFNTSFSCRDKFISKLPYIPHLLTAATFSSTTKKLKYQQKKNYTFVEIWVGELLITQIIRRVEIISYNCYQLCKSWHMAYIFYEDKVDSLPNHSFCFYLSSSKSIQNSYSADNLCRNLTQL